jgi:hypothetical protein
LATAIRAFNTFTSTTTSISLLAKETSDQFKEFCKKRGIVLLEDKVKDE